MDEDMERNYCVGAAGALISRRNTAHMCGDEDVAVCVGVCVSALRRAVCATRA